MADEVAAVSAVIREETPDHAPVLVADCRDPDLTGQFDVTLIMMGVDEKRLRGISKTPERPFLEAKSNPQLSSPPISKPRKSPYDQSQLEGLDIPAYIRRPIGSGSSNVHAPAPEKGSVGSDGDGVSGRVLPAPKNDLSDPPLDDVHFSVTAPSIVARSQTYLMDVWAHLDAQRAEVLSRAHEEWADPAERLAIRSTGAREIARETSVTVHPRIRGFTIDPPEAAISWKGRVERETFFVTVPDQVSLGDYPGICEIRCGGLKIADLRFLARVGRDHEPVHPVPTVETRVRRAFASYASHDRDAVLGRVQGLHKAAPGLDIFIDVASLRSGQRWRDALRDEIVRRDVLYLFWSHAARESEWVAWEWKCALREKGIDSIDPLPLAPPHVVPPPPELAELHFNDWVLAFQRLQSP